MLNFDAITPVTNGNQSSPPNIIGVGTPDFIGTQGASNFLSSDGLIFRNINMKFPSTNISAFSPGNSGLRWGATWLFCDYNSSKIMYSQNDGETWNIANVPTYNGGYQSILAITKYNWLVATGSFSATNVKIILSQDGIDWVDEPIGYSIPSGRLAVIRDIGIFDRYIIVPIVTYDNVFPYGNPRLTIRYFDVVSGTWNQTDDIFQGTSFIETVDSIIEKDGSVYLFLSNRIDTPPTSHLEYWVLSSTNLQAWTSNKTISISRADFPVRIVNPIVSGNSIVAVDFNVQNLTKALIYSSNGIHWSDSVTPPGAENYIEPGAFPTPAGLVAYPGILSSNNGQTWTYIKGLIPTYVAYSKNPIISGVSIVSDFSFTPTTGVQPLTINASFIGIGDPVSYSWTVKLGAVTVATSSDPNPSFVLSTSGMDETFDITLTVTNAIGNSNSRTKSIFVWGQIQPIIFDDFSASGMYVSAGPTTPLTNFAVGKASSGADRFVSMTTNYSTCFMMSTNDSKLSFVDSWNGSGIGILSFDMTQGGNVSPVDLTIGNAVGVRITMPWVQIVNWYQGFETISVSINDQPYVAFDIPYGSNIPSQVSYDLPFSNWQTDLTQVYSVKLKFDSGDFTGWNAIISRFECYKP